MSNDTIAGSGLEKMFYGQILSILVGEKRRQLIVIADFGCERLQEAVGLERPVVDA